MPSKEKLKCRKIPNVLQYHESNGYVHPGNYYHNILFMYYSFRREEELKGRSQPTYSEKFNEPEVAAVVNRNRRLIEPHAELVDETYETMQNIELDNEDSSSQHHNERESFLDQENVDDEGFDNAMYDDSLNNFRILTNIYQDCIINSNI